MKGITNKPNISDIANIIYPVGSIYMSVNNTSPATLFGGGWTQLTDKFLIGAGSTYEGGATGGEATHTLTIDEMPSHSHSGQYTISTGSGEKDGFIVTGNYTKSREGQIAADTGGSQSHNNLPPYLAVYMWKRTS